MKASSPLRTFAVISVARLALACGNALSADATPPPEIVKPIAPAKAEIAESAFKKLDATNKGYVDREDVRGLDGFDKAFDAADPTRTGRLSPPQFKKAWSIYTGH